MSAGRPQARKKASRAEGRSFAVTAFSLAGRVALVTGGGKGIGAAIARVLAEAGAAVTVVARSPADVEAVAKEIRAAGGRALACPADVTDFSQLPAVIDRSVREFGGLDIVVNCAGGGYEWRSFADMRAEQLDAAFRFTVLSVFELTRLALPHLLASPGASIINIGSVTVGKSMRGHLVYETAKAALTQLTKSLAADLGPRVRVNIIHPGATETPALRGVLDNAPPEMRLSMIERTRLRRNGTPDDIACAALYLASPASAWVTGTELHVNGGAVDEISSRFPDLG
jgi:7-alpha-hydroxysteroid dehydrogenase